MEKKFNQNEYIKQFTKDNYKHYHLMINNNKEAIIKHLENQESKNAYIINLIDKDIRGTNDYRFIDKNGNIWTEYSLEQNGIKLKDIKISGVDKDIFKIKGSKTIMLNIYIDNEIGD